MARLQCEVNFIYRSVLNSESGLYAINVRYFVIRDTVEVFVTNRAIFLSYGVHKIRFVALKWREKFFLPEAVVI